jgi:hypothetical protein
MTKISLPFTALVNVASMTPVLIDTVFYVKSDWILINLEHNVGQFLLVPHHIMTVCVISIFPPPDSLRF